MVSGKLLFTFIFKNVKTKTLNTMKTLKRFIAYIKKFLQIKITLNVIVYKTELPIVLRYCRVCRKYKTENNFEKGDSYKDGLNSVCNSCRTEKSASMMNVIIEVISDHTNIPEKLLIQETRKREIVEARHYVMFFGKELTKYSLSKIGLYVGKPDHSTVLHGIKTMHNLYDTSKKTKYLIDIMRNDILNRTKDLRSVRLKVAN